MKSSTEVPLSHSELNALLRDDGTVNDYNSFTTTPRRRRKLRPSLWAVNYMGLSVTLDENLILPSLWHLVKHLGGTPILYVYASLLCAII